MVLDWRHEERVAHESRETLEVERWREVFARAYEVDRGVGVFLVVVGHFYPI